MIDQVYAMHLGLGSTSYFHRLLHSTEESNYGRLPWCEAIDLHFLC
jgi:hypothetical protein